MAKSRQMPGDKVKVRENLSRIGKSIKDLRNYIPEGTPERLEKQSGLAYLEKLHARYSGLARRFGALEGIATGIPSKFLQIYEDTKPSRGRGPKST